MIVYSVTVRVDASIRQDWEQWMRETHIPDVMATGAFKECRMTKIIEPDESESSGFNMQYLCENYSDLEEYRENHAPALRQEHGQRYKGQFSSFRTLLEVKQNF